MASTINGTSTGSGGLISTGDGSGILNIQTNETTAVSINASQGVEFNAGTAALPSITTSGDTNTGIFFPAADTIAFSEGGAEAVRIDASGNLLVGKTSTSLTTQGIQIAPNAEMFIARIAPDQTLRFYNASTGTQVGSIVVGTSSTAYNTSSDYRLKHDIQPMTGALAKVAALKPVTYKWNSDCADGEGFLAHELAEVVPQAVYGEKDADET